MIKHAAAAVTVAVMALAGVMIAAPGQAAAATSDTVYVPPSGSLAVTGHGYGHGHGMSQYGAQGAALRGASAATILSFYYPGTVASTLPSAPVRVDITANAGLAVNVSWRNGLAVRDAVTGVTSTLPTAYPMWRIGYSVNAGYLLQYLSASAWHPYRSYPHPFGFTGPSTIRLWPARAATVDFAGVRSNAYRGELRQVWTGASLITLNSVAMDAYLLGVVPRESPAYFPAAALQAQTVAARSYAADKRATAAGRSYDVYDTTADQVYGGYAGYASAGAAPVVFEQSSTNAAVLVTANQVRSYGGFPILAQFSPSNGGFTAAGGLPYLVAKADPYERYSSSPYQTWIASADVVSLRDVAGLKTLFRMQVWRETSAGGHVSSVAFVGTDWANRAVTVGRTGDEVRSYFGWRSTYFGFDATGATDGGPTGPWPLAGSQVFAYAGSARVINGVPDSQAQYRPDIAAIQREVGVPQTSRYDSATWRRVEYWQGLVGLPQNGVVDKTTWDTMTTR